MEKKLKALFEFQRFENDPKLKSLIEETENRYQRELSDDDLWMVNAAGVPDLPEFEFRKQQEKIPMRHNK